MIHIPDNIKADFEKWYDEYQEKTVDINNYCPFVEDFYILPFEMQSGVWIAYCVTKKKGFFDDPHDFKMKLNAVVFLLAEGMNKEVIKHLNQALKLISDEN